MQYSDQLGGALQLQVYSGRDNKFTLFEDDGISLDYQTGVFKATDFSWNDSTRTLTWNVTRETSFSGALFTQMDVILFSESSVVSKSTNLNTSGEIHF